MKLNELNSKFSDIDQIQFKEGKGGMPMIEVNNQSAKALISIYGAQVLSYIPGNQNQDLLFVSDKAYFQQGKAIKGGIPICWPWFGQDPLNQGRSAHGFARNMLWRVLDIKSISNLSTTIILELSDSDITRSIWPYTFNLQLQITISNTLKMELISHNTDEKDIIITQALHSYFLIDDITNTYVQGLDNKFYLDKASIAKGGNYNQEGDIYIEEEVDRIYLDVPPSLNIINKQSKRNININSQGNKTAIVWNPWRDIAKQMGDLNENDYLQFICVETANAADDIITIKPGEKYCLGVEYSTSSN
ncbi:MAG: D-hexose-6-phosphate mutarotase [Gammaproteobacteria bacterium]|nr:D-hexose-6-phosphate mutarotase [Gammaproteobacteria bacterium]